LYEDGGISHIEKPRLPFGDVMFGASCGVKPDLPYLFRTKPSLRNMRHFISSQWHFAR
jgi:hypothetical protein